MGASVDHLQRQSKTGRLSYRRVFPAELRPHIPGQPRELKRSLAASRIDTPGALERYKAAAADYDRLSAIARKAASGAFDPLEDADIAFLAETYRTALLTRDESARLAGTAPDDDEQWMDMATHTPEATLRLPVVCLRMTPRRSWLLRASEPIPLPMSS
jgi:hypothetical protein